MAVRRKKKAIAESLGQRLRARRNEMGLTQVQLAERADTTQAVIQKIENGKSLRPRKIDKIASALGVKAAWLMFGNDRFDALDKEALEIATAWSKLAESKRTDLRKRILGAS
mgnify:CR=1 FL=1|jgi:transcriptional regulator with XRE-family HTH domain